MVGFYFKYLPYSVEVLVGLYQKITFQVTMLSMVNTSKGITKHACDAYLCLFLRFCLSIANL